MRSLLNVVIIIIITTIEDVIILLLCGVHETGSEAMRLHVNVGRYTPTANSVNIIHIFIVIKYCDVIIDILLLIIVKYKYNYNVLTVQLSVYTTLVFTATVQ